MTLNIIMKRNTVVFAITATSTLFSANVLSHANIAQKDAYNTDDGRSYLEGTSAEIKLNLSHSCSADLPTVVTTMAVPNSPSIEIYDLGYDKKTKTVTGNPNISKKSTKYNSTADFFYTTDGKGTNYAGNALMGIKPSVDNNWQEILPKKGDVPNFYNHGPNTRDVLGIHWQGGNIPNDFYYDLKFRGSFPQFKPDSCVSKVRVYLPAIQYCGTDMNNLTKQDNWLPKPSPLAGITQVTTGYAPYFDIDRNLKKNPLPENCGSDLEHEQEHGDIVGLYPSDQDISDFLVSGGQGGSAGGVNLSKITNQTDCTKAGGTWMSHDGGNTFMCM